MGEDHIYICAISNNVEDLSSYVLKKYTYPCFQQIELELSIASNFLESPKRASDLQARPWLSCKLQLPKICPAKRVVPITHTESQPIWLLVFKVYDDEYDIIWYKLYLMNKLYPYSSYDQ
jgi:hypothetical protein